MRKAFGSAVNGRTHGERTEEHTGERTEEQLLPPCFDSKVVFGAEDPQAFPKTVIVPKPTPEPAPPAAEVSRAPTQQETPSDYIPAPPGAPNPAGVWQEPKVPKVTQTRLPERSSIEIRHKRGPKPLKETTAAGDAGKPAGGGSAPPACEQLTSSPAVSSSEPRLVAMPGHVEIGIVKLPDGMQISEMPVGGDIPISKLPTEGPHFDSFQGVPDVVDGVGCRDGMPEPEKSAMYVCQICKKTPPPLGPDRVSENWYAMPDGSGWKCGACYKAEKSGAEEVCQVCKKAVPLPGPNGRRDKVWHRVKIGKPGWICDPCYKAALEKLKPVEPAQPPSKAALKRQFLRVSAQFAKAQAELEKFGKKLEGL